ncbi:MAG: biotin/lipoyl-binding protein [Blautia sp.]|jgi:HlyD family secretion protein
MKRKIAIIGGIVVVAGLLAGFGWHFFGDRISGGSKDSGNVVYVSTVSSLTETASGTQNRYAGVVEPQQTVEVKLESNRVVKDVKVTAGQEVKAGTPLFEYDASASQDDLEQAQLELEQLKNDVMSLQDQLATLEKEKKTATQDNQLSYTIQIQQTKMDIKKNEYSQKSKAKEIEKLQSAAANTVITSEIDGVIKSIDTSKLDENSSGSPGDLDMMNSGSGDGENSAFITILGTGTYRVKGVVNETNASSIIEGSPVIIRSRVDQDKTWQGAMGTVDREHPINSSNSGGGSMVIGYGMSSGGEEAQTSSSSYPFYVSLEDASGLMLGQHVYIEMDFGQDEVKDGLWLDSFYIADVDKAPYVWMANDKDKLVKQPVELGEYDENLDKYEIVKGLDMEDCIAYPTAALEEGLPTEINDGAQIPYTGGDEGQNPEEGLPADGENAEEGTPIDGEPLDDSPMIEQGPGADADLSEQDMENISESPDGPFADDVIVQENVQEGVAP